MGSVGAVYTMGGHFILCRPFLGQKLFEERTKEEVKGDEEGRIDW